MAKLSPRMTHGAAVSAQGSSSWQLMIPRGMKNTYRLAQLDDYLNLPRRDFPYEPPLTLRLSARASTTELHGTWGFGLWNDPFAMSLGFQGKLRRLPAFPNCAWFFFASQENHLALRKDIPSNGMLTAVFSSPRATLLLRTLAGLSLPLAFAGLTSSLPRLVLKKFIQEDAVQIRRDWREWHQFKIHWKSDSVTFWVDGKICHRSTISPLGRLGIVIWIDNQYARFAPGERLKFGTLETDQDCTLEIKDLELGVE